LRSEVSRSEIEIHHQREDVGNRKDRLATLDENWRTASAELIQYRLQENLHSSQSLLAQFAEARSSYYGTSKAIGNSLSKIKGWASTALSLHQNFPLEAGLFDYVIVDEASQCHLAYILPAAYRAKHLVIVGDANQLSPIPQLTDAQERSIARRNGLATEDLENYRLSSARFSAFDAFSKIVGADSVYLLMEHFRSHPQIARWFNETFYQSQLRVLTDISTIQHEGRVLTWLETRGEASRPGPGKGSWINLAEAEAVAEIVLSQISLGRSIGVVTPFSAQENLIREIIYSKASRDVLGEVNFRVGTAHKFQGDERDTIVFSSVLAPGISKKSASWLQGGDGRRLLNVSVSRAREKLIVVGHPEISQFECAILTSLQMFIRTVHEFEDNRINPQFDSMPEEKLYEAMIAVGLDPLSKVNVEGYDLDFSLVTGSAKIDIEVDGDQHYRSALGSHLGLCREDISRDRVLMRAGWQVLRIPAWECVKYPERSATSVLDLVGSIES
jgi:very-short-patch-repair endonuclease